MSRSLLFVFVGLLVIALTACNRDNAEAGREGIQSLVTGRISLTPAADSAGSKPTDFGVLIYRTTSQGIDTLGYAPVDSSGAFSMQAQAPERGLYPLAIVRGDSVIKGGDIVLAGGDTAAFNARLPMGSRPLIVRSRENGALWAYRNATIQYTQAVQELSETEKLTEEALRDRAALTSAVLWSVREQYPNTLASDLAAAESVVLLEGVDDSLLIERAQTIQPRNPSFAEVARTARRVQTRRYGFTPGLSMLDLFARKAETDEQRAALAAERVVAHVEAGREADALSLARELSDRYPDSEWAGWADRLAFDMENLMPGMQAPDFTLVTQDGGSISLDQLRGKLVLLEFYSPRDETYLQELATRNALYRAGAPAGLEIVSVSLIPDEAVNRRYQQLVGDFPGIQAIVSAGTASDVSRWYNVNVTPKRILIDREGRIVSSYEGAFMQTIVQEVAALLARERQPS